MECAIGIWQVGNNMIYILGGLGLSCVVVTAGARTIKSDGDEHRWGVQRSYGSCKDNGYGNWGQGAKKGRGGQE